MSDIGTISLGELAANENSALRISITKELMQVQVTFPAKTMEVNEIFEFIDQQSGTRHFFIACDWDFCTLLLGCRDRGAPYFILNKISSDQVNY